MATSKKRRGPSGKPPSGRPTMPAGKADPAAAKPKETRPADKPRQSKRERAEARAAAARRRRRRNAILLSAGGVLVIGLLAVLVFTGGEAEGSTDPAAWDLPAMGPTEDVQERVTLAEFQGKPTVVNFFASWCVECDRELPGFAAVSRELEGQVNFVGIASQETGNPLFMPEKHGVDWWPLARDIGSPNGSGLSRALGARGMPLTAFYDADGVLVHVQLGSIVEPQLRAALNQFYGLEM